MKIGIFVTNENKIYFRTKSHNSIKTKVKIFNIGRNRTLFILKLCKTFVIFGVRKLGFSSDMSHLYFL